jgi:predicted ATP-dependent endonuclease of OLD family
MFIKELKIKNFKCFADLPKLEFQIPNGKLGSGLNILVGNNNCGKSTILEALEILNINKGKLQKELKNKNYSEKEMSIEITLTDNKKDITIKLTEDKQPILNSNDNKDLSFTELSKLFEIAILKPTDDPNKQINYGAKTIFRNILKESVDLEKTEQYKQLQSYLTGDLASAFEKEFLNTRVEIQNRCTEQFNMPLTIESEFGEIKAEDLFKIQNLNIDDGISTPLEYKGSGMQRAVMLSMLQVYAKIICKKSNKEEKVKTLLLLLDEPENCLHPKAQKKLLEALITISKNQQVFIATHSHYFFHTQNIQNIGCYLFNTENNTNKVESIEEISLLPWGPTWGEINYFAYDMPTIELHNELYGFLHDNNCESSPIDKFDTWLQLKLDGKELKEYKRDTQLKKITLCTYIRNQIHHPENLENQKNGKNKKYTTTELKDSINILIDIIKKEKEKKGEEEEKKKKEEEKAITSSQQPSETSKPKKTPVNVTSTKTKSNEPATEES